MFRMMTKKIVTRIEIVPLINQYVENQERFLKGTLYTYVYIFNI